MSDNPARPYATAAFAFAVERDAVADWGGKLSLWSEILAQVKTAVGGRLVSDAQLAEVVVAAAESYSAAADSPELLDALVTEASSSATDKTNEGQKNFLAVLSENGRLSLLPQIAALFERLTREKEGVLSVRVESARAMSADEQKRFDEYLHRRFGQKITAQYEENPDLLGGVRVYAKDDVIDASILGRLHKLTAAMRRS